MPHHKPWLLINLSQIELITLLIKQAFCALARFVVLGVVPFVSISFLNYKIWLVVRQRRRSGRRVAEDNLSVLLMTIVASFLICNSPRIFLNMHEITVIKEIYVCRSD